MNEKPPGIGEEIFHAGESGKITVVGPRTGDRSCYPGNKAMTWEEYIPFFLPMLAPDFQVFAISLPGHGKSSWTPPGNYTFDQLGVAVSEFPARGGWPPGDRRWELLRRVLAMWLAANAPEFGNGVSNRGRSVFRAEWPAIKNSVVYDVFLGLAQTAIPGSGGFPKFFLDTLAPMAQELDTMADMTAPPKPVLQLAAAWMRLHQTLRPALPSTSISPTKCGFPAQLLPLRWHFSRAFVDGTVGAGFDHATALAQITQPMHVPSRKLVYVRRPHRRRTHRRRRRACEVTRHRGIRLRRLPSGHFIPLEKPELENTEIRRFLDQ